MITTESIRMEMDIEALQEGEGFNVKLKTSWRVNNDKSNLEAIKIANENGLLGLILNGHESTPPDALNRLNTELTNFWSAINTIIDNQNA